MKPKPSAAPTILLPAAGCTKNVRMEIQTMNQMLTDSSPIEVRVIAEFSIVLHLLCGGLTTNEAEALGCSYDPLAGCWLHKECPHDFTDEFALAFECFGICE
jgi:hypothetical protein